MASTASLRIADMRTMILDDPSPRSSSVTRQAFTVAWAGQNFRSAPAISKPFNSGPLNLSPPAACSNQTRKLSPSGIVCRYKGPQYSIFSPYAMALAESASRAVTAIPYEDYPATLRQWRPDSLPPPRSVRLHDPLPTRLLPGSFRYQSREIAAPWRARTRSVTKSPPPTPGAGWKWNRRCNRRAPSRAQRQKRSNVFTIGPERIKKPLNPTR